jgi:hypothetical protein
MIIKLKYIISTKDVHKEEYDWETLRESIKTKGYDTNEYGKISVISFYKDYYLVMNGNHRLFILNEFYDNDYKVEVETFTFFSIVINGKVWKNILVLIIFGVWFFYNLISFIIKYHKNKLFIKK